MDLSNYGILTLASYLNKISGELTKEIDKLYRYQGLSISSRLVPCLLLINDLGHVSVTQLAEKLGQTHSAVSQMSRKLIAQNLIFDSQDPNDERKRLLFLTPHGYEVLDKLEMNFRIIRKQIETILKGKSAQLLSLLAELENAQSQLPFRYRVIKSLESHQHNVLRIVEYDQKYKHDFKRLNMDWLEKYFYVEEIDNQILSNPDEFILETGGHIMIAILNDKVVGTAALISASKDRFELSKMSVSQDFQGLGIGRKLANKAIDIYKKSGRTGLFLESSSKLKPALSLYESLGFVAIPKPDGDSHYQRADVYMEFLPIPT